MTSANVLALSASRRKHSPSKQSTTLPSQTMTSLPRAITTPAAIILAIATGCVVLSSLFAPTKTTSPGGDHDYDAPQRRALRLKLISRQEVIRYSDPKTVQARVPDEIDGSLWWKNIDYAQLPLCGGAKCFFRSVSDPANGYLIWDANFEPQSNRYGYSSAVKLYYYGVELESEYKIRHFFTGPPFAMETPEYFREHLTGDYRGRFHEVQSLVVQPSRTAPEFSIVFRCYSYNVKFGRLHMILGSMNQEAKQRLVDELKYTFRVIYTHPELMNDFQLMIDRDGQLYHLDFDRILKGYPTRFSRKKFGTCLQDAAAYVRQSMT